MNHILSIKHSYCVIERINNGNRGSVTAGRITKHIPANQLISSTADLREPRARRRGQGNRVGGPRVGGGDEFLEAELNLDIKHRRERREGGGGTWARDVRKERRPDSICSPPVGIPRMLQQCGNRLHPITLKAF